MVLHTNIPFLKHKYWTSLKKLTRVKIQIYLSQMSVMMKRKRMFYNIETCGPYYKHVTVVNDASLSNAPNCVITYGRN